MSIINIISNNICELNLNVTGIFNITLVSVSGKFNPIILNIDDFITFEVVGKSYDMHINNVISKGDISSHIEYLNTCFTSWYVDKFGTQPSKLFDIDMLNGLIIFPLPIKFCTNRLKHLLGILTLPSERTEERGVEMGQMCFNDNGANFLLIKCDKLNTPMRFSHQTTDKLSAKYPAITNIVSLNLNNFSLSYPFQLTGNQFILSSKDLVGLEFKITDIYDEDIEFMNELLWTFQIEKIADELIPSSEDVVQNTQ